MGDKVITEIVYFTTVTNLWYIIFYFSCQVLERLLSHSTSDLTIERKGPQHTLSIELYNVS